MRRLTFSVIVLMSFVTAAAAEERCSGCGCKGGPGYRSPSGHCVGWAQLSRVCGTPPSARCSAEGPALIALGAAAIAKATGVGGSPDTRATLAPARPDEGAVAISSNQLRAKADGTACISAITVQAVEACPKRAPPVDCATERRTLIDTGACVGIAAGTVVTIQAGSRSFDWLRFKVPERGLELWGQRSLFLAR